jgi:hypothetical protein
VVWSFAVGLRQHSHSWFRISSGPMVTFCFSLCLGGPGIFYVNLHCNRTIPLQKQILKTAATMFAETFGNFIHSVFPNAELTLYTPAAQTYEYIDSVCNSPIQCFKEGTRGSVVGGGSMLQAGRSPFRFPMRLLDF